MTMYKEKIYIKKIRYKKCNGRKKFYYVIYLFIVYFIKYNYTFNININLNVIL